MSKIFGSIIKYLIWIISIIIILSIWEINIVPALTGLGLLGVVVGLGAQKFINDLISGFFIIFEEHFDVGDVIEVNNFKGIVIDMGLKTTKIESWKGEIKILPNGSIDNCINYSKNNSLAVIEIFINFNEDINLVINLLNTNLKNYKDNDIIGFPYVMGITNLKENLELTIICTCVTEHHYHIERDLRLYIKNLLDLNNIKFGFTNINIMN